MFNKQSIAKNQYMLTRGYKKRGYDWWWHSFTGVDEQTGEEKAFFIEFFIVNPIGKELSLGQAKNGNIPHYLMIKCGSWGKEAIQLHRFIPLKNVNITRKPIKIEALDCYLDSNHIKGNVEVLDHIEGDMSDLGRMSFDLELDKKIAFNVGYGTSWLFRFLHAFEMYWHAEGIKTLVSGSVVLNDRRYKVIKEKSYGYCDKNWGKDFTSPWVWLSSWDLYSKKYNKQLTNSAFDIGGGRPKVFGIALPRKLLSALYYEGKEYEYNFSKFWKRTKTIFSFDIKDKLAKWNIISTSRKTKMELEIFCNIDEMLFINYENPKGEKKFEELYNGGTGYGNLKIYQKNKKEYILLDDIDVNHVGCEYGEFAQK